MPPLSLATLDRLPRGVAPPAFDPAKLGVGILHLGVGNFHRAHQAVFTEDAIAKAGGAWGILGVSLKHSRMARAMAAQSNLYTVETIAEPRRYRVVGVLRETVWAEEEGPVLVAFASPDVHVVTITVTEKGYCLKNGELDAENPDVCHDLTESGRPRSLAGWLIHGFAARKAAGAGPLTVISCDNLASNGTVLARALGTFAEASDPELGRWIADKVRFPNTMVDCIVPATSPDTIARVEKAIGFSDAVPVAREPFAQWVIENSFAAPRPQWEIAGAEIVPDVAPFERLKLHVLNAAHSTLAYLGLRRGHEFVRQAISDPELSQFLNAMIADEIAPALAPLDVATYWTSVRARFSNPSLDHRLAQIAEDGSAKLAQRVFPLLIENARAGRPNARLALVVRAWLAFARGGAVKDPEVRRLLQWARSGGRLSDALDDAALFPEPFRTDARVRDAILKEPA